MSPSEERVRAALAFRQPDRVPRFDSFWPEFEAIWRREMGLESDVTPEDYYGIDLVVAVADETPWPSRARVLADDGRERVSVDGWGRTVRSRADAVLSETIGVAVSDSGSLDSLAFDPPSLPERYGGYLATVRAQHPKRAVFAKTGGPFLRTCFVRGETDFLMDLAADEGFAAELAAMVNDHITAVGVESLRLEAGSLCGIWIYDDVAANAGPMVSPRTYERVFLPLMAAMVAAYRAAGADFVVFHSDGNILPLLPMLIEAGVDAINPVEPKAGMDAVAIRERYGKQLALIGGLDNAFDLPSGDWERIAASVRHVLQAGREGGLILGSHSIGPDVSVPTYAYLHQLEEAASYPL
ncbi:MAG: uroporphyrinogen decarboxylase family protein [Anaerolineae bacterium]